jgi:hypothetical protein
MNKKKKGESGYIRYRQLVQALWVLTGACIIAALLILGLVRNSGDRNNYFTLAAVLVVLPTAKTAVNLSMLLRYGKCSPKEQYEELAAMKNDALLLSDMIITIKDRLTGIDFAVVTDTGICCYTQDQDVSTSDFCEGVENFVRSCGYDIHVTVLKDFKKFKERVHTLSGVKIDSNKAEEIRHAFLIMSL